MFIGRRKELDAMQSLYDKDGFGMMVIYGRRRIGKSTLINEFIKNKNAIFYTATKVGQNRNLELFAKQVISVLDPDFESASFPSTEDIFNFITKKLPDKKIVLVIDELPYWAEKDDSLLSILQKYIDTEWQNKNLFIILCGSALSFMEKKVLSEKSPLFGRRDSQIKLEAFNYKDSALFVPNYSFEEKAICYGITGGVAKYLSMIDKNKTLDENIKHLFFHTDGYLYDETRNLLTQEFMDIALVNNIIEQIASGQNTINLISEKVKEKASTVLYSIDKLMEVGLIEKKNCITEEKNKKKMLLKLFLSTLYLSAFTFGGMNLFRKQPVSLKWGMEISIMKKQLNLICILIWEAFLKRCADTIHWNRVFVENSIILLQELAPGGEMKRWNQKMVKNISNLQILIL